MQIAMINERARGRYAAFVGAMDCVLEALERVDKLLATADERRTTGGFTGATLAELVAYRLTAFESLDALRTSARKYEAELVSREWRL